MALSLGALSGCGLLPDEVDETKNWSADKLYHTAKSNLEDANYAEAVKLYEKLEARYPYGAYAQQAQLEIAYAYYKDNEPLSAVAACERFIKLHPQHPHVDYAYYLKGLANFVEDESLLASLGKQDMSERDPKAARDAFDAFQQLVQRFPQSPYADDSAARMRYLVNALASHETHVARYYFKRGAYVAAANRGKYVLEHYPRAPALEEALHLMASSYDKLGLNDLRDDALRVMRLNFPDSVWLGGQPKPAPQAEKSADGKPAWWQFWKSSPPPDTPPRQP